MKQAFDKILERLEEPQFDIGCGACPYKDKCDEVQETIDDEMTDLCAETMRVIAKQIVQEVAEEYISTEHINCSADTSTNTSTNGWIACSDRLPEECVPVNVTWINRNPESYYAKIKDVPFSATAVYYNSKWYWYSSTCVDYLSEYGKNDFDLVDKDIDVVAWQPLPEPFKERD